MSISAFGNKQVNVRLEPDLYNEIKEAAAAENTGIQDWIRLACRQALGHDLDLPVKRSELEPLAQRIQSLEGEVADLKKL